KYVKDHLSILSSQFKTQKFKEEFKKDKIEGYLMDKLSKEPLFALYQLNAIYLNINKIFSKETKAFKDGVITIIKKLYLENLQKLNKNEITPVQLNEITSSPLSAPEEKSTSIIPRSRIKVDKLIDIRG